MADDLLVRIDVDSSQALAATSAYAKANDRLAAQLSLTAKAQAKLDAALAAGGAGTDKAVAAQARLDASLKRTSAAETQVAIAAARSAEVQAAASAKAASAAEAASVKQAAAMRRIGTIAGGVGLLAAAGLGLAAKAASDYNAKMAEVATLTRGSAAEMAKLSDATGNFANLGISATEAADAEIALVKAGLSVADITGGALAGSLNLAAAGQLAVADATSIAAQAMTQFQLAGSDVGHIADLLSAGANKALGSVQDLGTGLGYAGLSAHQLGLSVDETVATLAEFAQAGLIGSQGGAAFQQMLLKLENPTAAAAAAMDKYNLSLYDAQGNFVGMQALAGQLQTHLRGLSQEQRLATLATLFGSRAVRAANVLYQDGAKGVAEWQAKVEDSGNAARTAAGKLDSLQGDMQKLGAEVTNAAIAFGEQLQPALRVVTQGLGDFAGIMGSLPGPVKEAVALTLLFTAAVGLGTFAYTRASAALTSMGTTLGVVTTETTAAGVAQSTLNTKLLALRGSAALVGIGLLTLASNSDGATSSIASFGGTVALAATSGNPFVIMLGAAAGAAMFFKSATDELDSTLKGLKATIESQPLDFPAQLRAAADATAGLNAQTSLFDQVAGSAFTGAIPGMSLLMSHFADQTSGASDETANLTTEIKGLQAGYQAFSQELGGKLTFEQINAALKKTGMSIKEINSLMLNRNRSAPDAVAWQQAVSSVKLYDEATGHLVTVEDQLADAAGKALTKILGLDNAMLGKQGDWDNYLASLDAVGDALKKNNHSLDAGTELGRANRALIRGQASDALQFASDFKQGSVKWISVMEAARTKLYETRLAFGDTKAEARAYVDQVLQIPEDMKTKADIDTIQAKADIKSLIAQYNLTPATVTSVVTAAGATTAAAQVKALRDYINQLHNQEVTITYHQIGSPPGFNDQALAGGGVVYGRGTGTSDSNLIRASRGEFVVKQKAAERIGYGALHQMNRTGRIPQGLAGGGSVGRSLVGGGGTTHTYITDPSVVRELQAIHKMLDEKGLSIRNPGAFDARANSISRGNIAAAQGLADRLGLGEP